MEEVAEWKGKKMKVVRQMSGIRKGWAGSDRFPLFSIVNRVYCTCTEWVEMHTARFANLSEACSVLYIFN